MTIVEFFDEDAIENIASALLCRPDKVIFVGNNGKKMKKSRERYAQIMLDRGIEIEFDQKTAPRNNLGRIIEVLSEIAEQNEDCHFDIEGGDDLFLVAVGMVYQKFGGKIGLHRYNISNNTITDCDADGRPQLVASDEISVDENIKIYGGRVLYRDEHPKGTIHREFSEQECRDINRLWNVCKRSAGDWNFLVSDLAEIAENDGFSFVYPKKINHRDKNIFEGLVDERLIHSLNITPTEVTFTCKNELVRSCLLTAGLTLELYITATVKDILDEDGKPYYNDFKTGVFIDWDGKISEGADVENEIDVLMMRGMIPVFVSCKNGEVKSEELYKLSQVAERFGGKYAVKVLCVTDLSRTSGADAIKERAKSMDIKIVDNIADPNKNLIEELKF